MNIFNITDYGASQNAPDNTGAIQSAIDRCAASGGGRVVVPAGGCYRTDMLELRSHVELHIESGSVLKSILEPIPDPLETCAEPSCNTRRFLLGGVGVHNAAITGHGTIDGNGAEHFWTIDPARDYPLFGQRYFPRLHRPKGLIHFRESTDIRLSGVTILNPPCYTVWLLGCDRVNISGLKIDAPMSSPNTDGLDIDCCAGVHIENCDISTGDDAIAIKSDIHALGYDKPCENITVTNCRLKSSSCGIRLGYEGDGAIRNCIFHHLVIHQTMIGISLMSVVDPFNLRGIIIERGPHIHDIIFSGLVIDALQTFNFQHLKNADVPLIGQIDRILFRDITANAKRGSYIGGLPGHPIGQLDFSGVLLTVSGVMGEDFLHTVPEPYPVWNDLSSCGLPWAIFARHVRNLTIRNSTICKHHASGSWQQEMIQTRQVDSFIATNVDEVMTNE